MNQAIAGIAAGREEGSMEGGSEGGTEGTGAVAAAAYARNARHASSSPHTAVEIRAACPRYWRHLLPESLITSVSDIKVPT